MSQSPYQNVFACREEFLAKMKAKAEAPARARAKAEAEEAAIKAEAEALVEQFCRRPQAEGEQAAP